MGELQSAFSSSAQATASQSFSPRILEEQDAWKVPGCNRQCYSQPACTTDPNATSLLNGILFKQYSNGFQVPYGRDLAGLAVTGGQFKCRTPGFDVAAHDALQHITDLQIQMHLENFATAPTPPACPEFSSKCCAIDGAMCACSGFVRYGRWASWSDFKDLSQQGDLGPQEANVACTSGEFGGDPIPDVTKICECWSEKPSNGTNPGEPPVYVDGAVMQPVARSLACLLATLLFYSLVPIRS